MPEADLYALIGTLEPGGTPCFVPVTASNPLPVSATFSGSIVVPGTIVTSGTVDIGNFPATQDVTGTVAVSGTVTLGAATPLHVNTVSQTGGTIAATGTFQAGIAANSARVGGYIENLGTTGINVFFGTLGSATIADATLLENQGDAIDLTLGVPNGVYQGVVVVSGTTGGTYVMVENT